MRGPSEPSQHPSMTPRRLALEADKLSKAYRMYASPYRRLAEWGSGGRYKGHNEFWALKDVDLALVPGSSLGLCGANGAGKSTLLKILAGTTTPSSGRFKIHGRVASLLELGAGFHLDFTGRANILMNGTMMGFSRREILAKVDEIIEFAELGAFIDEPVRTYSSGMGLRLGFAVAMAVDPEVMIIDEVFAVGDMYFQKKCIDKIYEFKERNKTILFCSHSLYDIRQLCDDALWLHHGQPMKLSDSVTVTNEYTTYQTQHIDTQSDFIPDDNPIAPPHEEDRAVESLPSILRAGVYPKGGSEETYEISTGEDVELRIWWRNPSHEHEGVQLGVGFFGRDMSTLAGCLTELGEHQLEGPAGCTVLELPAQSFLPHPLLIGVVLFDEAGVHKYQQYMLPGEIKVTTRTKEVGIFRLHHGWHERPDLADRVPADAVEAEAAARGNDA